MSLYNSNSIATTLTTLSLGTMIAPAMSSAIDNTWPLMSRDNHAYYTHFDESPFEWRNMLEKRLSQQLEEFGGPDFIPALVSFTIDWLKNKGKNLQDARLERGIDGEDGFPYVDLHFVTDISEENILDWEFDYFMDMGKANIKEPFNVVIGLSAA